MSLRRWNTSLVSGNSSVFPIHDLTNRCAWNGVNTVYIYLIEEGFRLSKIVLLLDNLKGQIQKDFRTAVFSANGLFWYGLSDATDLWQPVDAGYAFCLKS